jgi:hypothetical protein
MMVPLMMKEVGRRFKQQDCMIRGSGLVLQRIELCSLLVAFAVYELWFPIGRKDPGGFSALGVGLSHSGIGCDGGLARSGVSFPDHGKSIFEGNYWNPASMVG